MTSFDHAFWTYFFTRKKKPYVKWFVIGSVSPDLIYFFAFAYMGIKEAVLNPQLIFELIKLVISGYSPDVLSDQSFRRINLLFGKVFADPYVATVRMITHSLFLWGIAYFTLIWTKGGKLGASKAFLLGWCGHLIVDVFTHVTDAVSFLFPVSNWTLRGPISYWNPDFYGREFYLINLALTAFSIIFLFYEGVKERWKKSIGGFLFSPKNGYRYQALKRRIRP
ncbi:zinc dependent phospholipase C family protein [Robertmurraya sp.]|uniref:zinc dependent phospholipase C family protein n=1 Tax=Robertmurraya sp. TaxID=2837525 RepID=UPI003703DC0A